MGKKVIICCLSLMLVCPANAEPSPLIPPVGTILPGSGEQLPGWPRWTIQVRASWCDQFSINCLFMRLRSGRTSVIALARPLEFDPRGGVQSAVLTKEFVVQMRPGEEVRDCRSPNSLPPVLGLLDEAKREVRTYSTDGKTLFMNGARYSGKPPCDRGED